MRAPAIILVLLAAGCTALVQPTEERVRCVVDGSDPCPEGERCLQGFCTPLPDAGGHCFDDDGGIVSCAKDPSERECGGLAGCPPGTLCRPSGECAVPDCSFVNGLCTSTQRCNLDADPPRCEALTPDNCTSDSDCLTVAGAICDSLTATCIQPRQLGEECSHDAQCAGADSGARCFEGAALGLTVSVTAKVCSRACCSNADCPSDSVCWGSGTGARGCVPRAMLSELDYEPCGRDGDCSDRCQVHQTAVSGQQRYTLACGSSSGWPSPGELGASCGGVFDVRGCASEICLDGLCSAACGSNHDCKSGGTCGYVRIGGREYVQACVFGDSGSKPQGASCASYTECAGWTCLQSPDGSSYCADACCTDADCGPKHVCRPVNFGDYWGMLCQLPDSST